MIGSFDKPIPSKNNGSRSAFNSNDNSKPAFEKNDGNCEVNRFDVGQNDVKHTKKSEKSSKSGKSKDKKMSKS